MSHADETRRLSNDLLISITSFFREPEAFQVLADQVVPQLFQAAFPQRPVRVWAPGCATGEEAYSVAMLLLEHRAMTDAKAEIRVFATDADEEALAKARAGAFSDSIAAEVSPERLERFFVRRDENHVRVGPELRKAVVFAPQNLLRHPPFSRMSLIVCRNLLIYLNQDAQENLLALFHYGLNPGGFLFLGSAEHISRHHDHFEPVSKRWRVYRRIGTDRRPLLDLRRSLWEASGNQASTPQAVPPAMRGSMEELAQELLVREFVPATALVDRDQCVVYLAGPMARFLEVPTGQPSHHLVQMVRPGLRPRLEAALYKSIRENASVTLAGAPVQHGAEETVATISIRPVKLPRTGEELWLVGFRESPAAPALGEAASPPMTDDALLRQVQHELLVTRHDLRASVADLETSNEELTASNEEAMSGNEELQSTNEELETSAEELQSLNEELGTVNAELHGKIGELEATSSDLANLLTSTDQPTLCLDHRGAIRWFSAAMTRLLPLVATDRGRPLSDFAQDLVGPGLIQDAQRVLATAAPVECEVQSQGKGWYLRRVLPFRTNDRSVDGVVATFIDITHRKLDEQQRELYERSLRSLNHQVVIAEEQERRRLALTLHDGLGQHLALVQIKLGAVHPGTSAAALRKVCKEAALIVEEAQQMTESLTFELSSPVLQDLGFVAAVRWLADHLQRRYQLPIAFEDDGQPKAVQDQVGVVLFRAIRELLVNTAKHAKATKAAVTLSREGDTVRAGVRDDGVGFDASSLLRPRGASDRGGFGLFSIREQLTHLGGQVEVRSSPGAGTTVTLAVPLTPPSAVPPEGQP